MLVSISKSARIKIIFTRNGEYITDMKSLTEIEFEFLTKLSARNHTSLTILIDKKCITHAVIVDLADLTNLK